MSQPASPPTITSQPAALGDACHEPALQDKLQKLLDLEEKPSSSTGSPTPPTKLSPSTSSPAHSMSPSSITRALPASSSASTCPTDAFATLSINANSQTKPLSPLSLPDSTDTALPKLQRQASLSSLLSPSFILLPQSNDDSSSNSASINAPVTTEQSEALYKDEENDDQDNAKTPQVSASVEVGAVTTSSPKVTATTTAAVTTTKSCVGSKLNSNATPFVPYASLSGGVNEDDQQRGADQDSTNVVNNVSPLMKRRHSDFGPISPSKRDYSPSADLTNWNIFGGMRGGNGGNGADSPTITGISDEIGPDVTRWVMVSNLPKTLSIDNLRVFREFGDVQYLSHKMLRAFGFITLGFFDIRDALKAARKISRLYIKDQKLKVKFCDKLTFTEMSEIILTDTDCCSELAISLLPATFDMEHLRDLLQAFGDTCLVQRTGDINGTLGLVFDFYDLREAHQARQGLADLINKVYGVKVLVELWSEAKANRDAHYIASSVKNRRIQTIKEESGYPDVASLLDQSLLQSITKEQNSHTPQGYRRQQLPLSSTGTTELTSPDWSFAPSLARRSSELSYPLGQQNMRREDFINASNNMYDHQGHGDRYNMPSNRNRSYLHGARSSGGGGSPPSGPIGSEHDMPLSGKTPELQTLLDDYFDNSSQIKAVMQAQRSLGSGGVAGTGNSGYPNDADRYRDALPQHIPGTGNNSNDYRPKQQRHQNYMSNFGGSNGGGSVNNGGQGSGINYSTCLRSNSVMPKVDFIPRENEFDIMRIMQGLDNRATVMIRNIPNKYSQQMLIDFINETHRGKYDFLYLRMDFKNRCNVGYAFCNMVDTNAIVTFAQRVVGKKWTKFNSDKVCMISYANIQGKQALVEKFRNSSVMDEHPSYRPKIFHSSGPLCGEEEPFPQPTTRSRGGLPAMSTMSEEEYERSTMMSRQVPFMDQYSRYSNYGGRSNNHSGGNHNANSYQHNVGGSAGSQGSNAPIYSSFDAPFSQSYPNTPSTKKLQTMDPWYQAYEYQTDVNLLSPNNTLAISAENALPVHGSQHAHSHEPTYSGYHSRF